MQEIIHNVTTKYSGCIEPQKEKIKSHEKNSLSFIAGSQFLLRGDAENYGNFRKKHLAIYEFKVVM